MKKPLSLLLALSLVLALTACGSKNDGANTDGDARTVKILRALISSSSPLLHDRNAQ